MEMADEAGDGWGAIVQRGTVRNSESMCRQQMYSCCELEASGDGVNGVNEVAFTSKVNVWQFPGYLGR